MILHLIKLLFKIWKYDAPSDQFMIQNMKVWFEKYDAPSDRLKKTGVEDLLFIWEDGLP